MHIFLIDLLECPVCHHQLTWSISRQKQDQIEWGDAQCTGCGASYPIRDGIGLFLTPDLPRNDLWERVGSHLTRDLADRPDIKQQLIDSPLEDLSPTDQHFRALILEEQGDFSTARKAAKAAIEGLYTPDYLACWQSQVDFVLDLLPTLDGPIIDLASGRCNLVERIAGQLNRPVVATDFSPSVLRGARALFQFLGMEHLVSLLSFDARRTPFKDDSLQIVTTNLGLPNIESPGQLMHELHRVVGGTFLAISHFFPTGDTANRDVIHNAQLDALLYRDSALQHFRSAGWRASLQNSCFANALPTPPGAVMQGYRIDGLPVAPTRLEWAVMHATPSTS